MNLPLWLALVLVRCRGCGRRNTVDLRRVRTRGWPKCGGCGAKLPWRLPNFVVAGALAVLVLAVLVGLVVAVMLEGRGESIRRDDVQRLVAEGRPVDALAALLPLPRSGRASDEARVVAAALAQPVLAVASVASPTAEAREAALTAADRLLGFHGDRLPELAELLEEPLLRLRAGREADVILAPAREAAASSAPRSETVEARLSVAFSRAEGQPAAVRRLVTEGASLLRDGLAIVAAREAAGARRPARARVALRSRIDAPGRVAAARRDQAPVPLTRVASGDGPPLVGHAALLAVQEALGSRSPAALARVLGLRGSGGGETVDAALDAALDRACAALASIEADGAATAAPEERVERLLRALTCDEVLPEEFVREGRAAIARTETALALGVGAAGTARVAQARIAWERLPAGPERSRSLAALACLAERGGRADHALEAWLQESDDAQLASGLACADEADAVALALLEQPLPRLDYPAPGPAGR